VGIATGVGTGIAPPAPGGGGVAPPAPALPRRALRSIFGFFSSAIEPSEAFLVASKIRKRA
jgi:hypothetical protein